MRKRDKLGEKRRERPLTYRRDVLVTPTEDQCTDPSVHMGRISLPMVSGAQEIQFFLLPLTDTSK